MKGKTVLRVTLERLISLAVFLLVLGLLNLIDVDRLVNVQIVDFLNQNVWVIIVMSVLFYLGELFFLFAFPLNIPAPVFNAIGSIFLVGFLFQIFYEIGRSLSQNVFSAFRFLEPVAIVLVFLIVFIVGCVRVIIGLLPERRKEEKKGKQGVSWSDVGQEFRDAMYRLASSLKDALEPKKGKKK